MSSSTMAKLTKNQPVAMPVLEKCAELKCNIEDIPVALVETAAPSAEQLAMIEAFKKRDGYKNSV